MNLAFDPQLICLASLALPGAATSMWLRNTRFCMRVSSSHKYNSIFSTRDSTVVNGFHVLGSPVKTRNGKFVDID